MEYYKARQLVKDILQQEEAIDLEECKPSDTLASKDIDSLNLVCLSLAIEEKLDTEIKELELKKIVTFKDLIDFVEKLPEAKCQTN